ncbi:MAG: 23S rRNA (pseudouridine(1915)-N(3))-methyltransferase RlmH [Alphaproteobacteria bacterium]|nr:23S rRNA (pseudouridine(1915)-N(3))-methyltransferase RlmH [Alphaproteobacteria bacterium]
MLKIEIIAVGRVRKGPYYEFIEEYKKRIQWPLTIHEIEAKSTEPVRAQQEESDKIQDKLSNSAIVVVLDERGDGLRSLDFAHTLDKFKNSGETHIQFVIGGADGLLDAVRDRADILLSFGQQTWPHLMARVMLLEQVYRAQQILAGHPYHRE